MFIAIFYGIQIIWERDAGVLAAATVAGIAASSLLLRRLAR
jgi:hypothetical protein